MSKTIEYELQLKMEEADMDAFPSLSCEDHYFSSIRKEQFNLEFLNDFRIEEIFYTNDLNLPIKSFKNSVYKKIEIGKKVKLRNLNNASHLNGHIGEIIDNSYFEDPMVNDYAVELPNGDLVSVDRQFVEQISESNCVFKLGDLVEFHIPLLDDKVYYGIGKIIEIKPHVVIIEEYTYGEDQSARISVDPNHIIGRPSFIPKNGKNSKSEYYGDSLPDVPKDGKAIDPKKEHLYKDYTRNDCEFHSWEIVGYNAFNKPWWNCKYCGIAKEDAEFKSGK